MNARERRALRFFGSILAVAAVAFALLILLDYSPTADKPALPMRTAEEKERDCWQYLECWDNRHRAAVMVTCIDLIDKQVMYDYEWTDGWSESKFDTMGWKYFETGELFSGGDKVIFQNAFGAWQHMAYRCNFTPNNDLVRLAVLRTR